MTHGNAPDVDCERQHPVLTVADVDAAIGFYTEKLGFKPGFTWGDPTAFAGVNLGGVQVFLKRGVPNPAGIEVYFVVDDADALHEFQRANGVVTLVPPGDREYGLRDYRVRDLDGYELSFGHNIFHVGDPIEIERVDVPLRLEKRLSALVQDMAAHKRMSLSSFMEETLLHTLDGVGPHTKSDLRKIQELKRKHGIDYDSHGSYRFKER
jgi:catechol 2,3-dioxygenase-like lactoylglutathione lyase family enzyme